jgi:hypothetical protein
VNTVVIFQEEGASVATCGIRVTISTLDVLAFLLFVVGTAWRHLVNYLAKSGVCNLQLALVFTISWTWTAHAVFRSHIDV